MLIPIGLPHMYQELMLLTKDEHTESLLGVAFVPLITDEEGVHEYRISWNTS